MSFSPKKEKRGITLYHDLLNKFALNQRAMAFTNNDTLSKITK